MSFDITPVGEADVGSVAITFCDAFGDTTLGPYGPAGYFLWSGWPGLNTLEGRKTTVQRFTKMYKAVQSSESTTWLKATERTSGAIVGSMLAVVYPGPTPEAVNAIPIDRALYPPGPEGQSDFELASSVRGGRDALCFDALRGLAKDEPLLNLKMLMISPKYQGRGVGRELIKKATERADELQANAFVHASEAGAAEHSYARAGFVTMVEGVVPNVDDGNNVGKRAPPTRIVAMVRKKA